MSWNWNNYAELLCNGYCIKRCAGDACPFMAKFEECKKLFHAVKALERKYRSMRKSGVDENDHRLLQLENLYDRAGDVYDCKYAALREAVSGEMTWLRSLYQ